MNDLKRISVVELNNISKKRKIWCLGCGKRFWDMAKNYEHERFFRSVTAVLDNNSNIYGKAIYIGSQRLEVKNYDVISELDSKKAILLITSDAVESIYETVKERYQDSVEIYVYPKYYRKSTYTWLKLFSKFNNKNRLLFCAGNEPHENADAVVSYVKKSNEYRNLKIVFLGESDVAEKTILNSDVTKKSSLIKMLRYCYYYGVSTYLFYENESLEKISPRQKLIYLNHGTIPLKRVDDVLKQTNELDFAVCPAEGCTSFYEEQYGIPRQKLVYAMPARTHAMFTFVGNNPWKKSNEKIILWLPTFRQLIGTLRRDSKADSFLNIVDSESGWKKIDEILKATNQRLLIKKHPRDGATISDKKDLSNIRFITDEDMRCRQININQLLATTDAVLTDYSGIAFEYMILDRPIGYVIQDFDDYNRGFSVDSPTEYMPGIIIKTFSQLCEFFYDAYRKDYMYKGERRAVVEKLFNGNEKEDGACKLVEMIADGRLLNGR